MKVIIKLKELMTSWRWCEYCEMKGIPSYVTALNMVNPEIEVTLTQEEAERLRLIVRINR